MPDTRRGGIGVGRWICARVLPLLAFPILFLLSLFPYINIFDGERRVSFWSLRSESSCNRAFNFLLFFSPNSIHSRLIFCHFLRISDPLPPPTDPSSSFFLFFFVVIFPLLILLPTRASFSSFRFLDICNTSRGKEGSVSLDVCRSGFFLY